MPTCLNICCKYGDISTNTIIKQTGLQTAKPSPTFWKGTRHYFRWPQEHWGKKVITNLPGPNKYQKVPKYRKTHQNTGNHTDIPESTVIYMVEN